MSLEVIGWVDPPRRDAVLIKSTIVEGPGTTWASAISELMDPTARNLAIQFAASQGMVSPSTTMARRPYPVDASGRPIMSALGEDGKPIKIDHYRLDVPLISNEL